MSPRHWMEWFEDGDIPAVLGSSGFQQVSVFDPAQLLGADPTGKKHVFLARKGHHSKSHGP